MERDRSTISKERRHGWLEGGWLLVLVFLLYQLVYLCGWTDAQITSDCLYFSNSNSKALIGQVGLEFVLLLFTLFYFC